MSEDGWAVTSGQYQRSRGGRRKPGGQPEWFRKQPHFVRGDEIYLRAYGRLSTERRPFGQELGPIPWSAVDRYARSYGFGPLMREWFVDVMLGLDCAFRARLKQQEQEAESKQRRRDLKAQKREAAKAGIQAVMERQ